MNKEPDTDGEYEYIKPTPKFSKKHKFSKKENNRSFKKSRSRSDSDDELGNIDQEDFTDEQEEIIHIKEFDISKMGPVNVDDKGVKLVVIGKPGTGKSTLIQDILAHKAHIIPVSQVFSGTEESNNFYSEKMPPITIFNKLDMTGIKNFVERQDLAKKYLKNPWAVQIIDDCTDNPRILKDPIFQAYYKNGRHWKMLHILSLQYCLDINPAIRTSIDYTFILRETSLRVREILWKNYASCVDNFHDFCQVMDQLTSDYTALVVNNKSQSNKLEDCVFYYKANPDKIPVNWKFGAGSFWQYNHDRIDTQAIESFI